MLLIFTKVLLTKKATHYWVAFINFKVHQ